MICTFLRSSSYGTHDLCPHRYWLEYTLHLPAPSGKKAALGTIMHKGAELLAWYKLCQQKGQEKFEDDNLGWVQVVDITPDSAIEWAFEYYVGLYPEHEWTKSDLETCRGWLYKAITMNKGMFDPRNRHVVCPEQKFDIELPHDWAHYDYGDGLKGQLRLKGTMDLILEDEPGMIEVVDWKSGRRLDWATGQEKTYQKLRRDPQLCLYHYATSKLFPHAEDIFVTIIFINDGGPFTLCFDKNDLQYTERIIERKFRAIRDCVRPTLLKDGNDWRCKRFCPFGGSHMSAEDPTKTICHFFKDKVIQEGIEKVTHDYARDTTFANYGSGGGRDAQ